MTAVRQNKKGGMEDEFIQQGRNADATDGGICSPIAPRVRSDYYRGCLDRMHMVSHAAHL